MVEITRNARDIDVSLSLIFARTWSISVAGVANSFNRCDNSTGAAIVFVILQRVEGFYDAESYGKQ